METFGKICASLLLMVFSILFGGFIFSSLWRWFIVPVFHWQVLSVAQSIGLGFFITYVKINPSNTLKKREDDKGTGELIGITAVYGLLVLGLGKILSLLIFFL